MAVKKGGSGKGGGKKQTSDKMSTLGSKAMRGEKLTPAQIRSLGASVVGQDEKKGKRTPPKKK